MIKLTIIHLSKAYGEKAKRHFSLQGSFAVPVILENVSDIRHMRNTGFPTNIILVHEKLLETTGLSDIRATCPNARIHLLCDRLSRAKMLICMKTGVSGFSFDEESLAQLTLNIREHMQKGAYIDGRLFNNIISDVLSEALEEKIIPEISEKEWTIVTLLSNGYQYKEIARLTGMGIDTIRYYVKSIYKKFEVKSKTQLSTLVHSLNRL
jgi:DNA-binding NarL/FixJ family response regulator